MLGTIPTDKQVVIYCNSGKRGEAATHSLHCKGLVNVSNLDGGLIEWRNSIDPSLPSD